MQFKHKDTGKLKAHRTRKKKNMQTISIKRIEQLFKYQLKQTSRQRVLPK